MKRGAGVKIGIAAHSRMAALALASSLATLAGVSSACRGLAVGAAAGNGSPVGPESALPDTCVVGGASLSGTSLASKTSVQEMDRWERSVAKLVPVPEDTAVQHTSASEPVVFRNAGGVLFGHQLEMVVVYPQRSTHTSFVGASTDYLTCTATRGGWGVDLDSDASVSWDRMVGQLSGGVSHGLTSSDALRISLLYISWASGWPTALRQDEYDIAGNVTWAPRRSSGIVYLKQVQMAPLMNGEWRFQAQLVDRIVRFRLSPDGRVVQEPLSN